MSLYTDHIRYWIFDLDNTLYPAELGIIEQAREAIMDFMAQKLSLTPDQAKQLYLELHKGHHSILKGLVSEYNLSPQEIFASLRKVDTSHVTPNNRLSEALEKLPGIKIIFTNATLDHAENMLSALDIRHHFDHIYDIESAGYIAKPHAETYHNLCQKFDIKPQHAIFFEDVPINLKPAHDIGMKTVFVRHNADSKETVEDYIHHYIDDITEGLFALIKKLQAKSA